MIHLSFFIRQLTSPKTRIFINHKWWHHFQVAGFFSFIEKEADKSPLQFCTFSLVNRKSCSCKFNAQIKINNIIFPNQIPVGETCFRREAGSWGAHVRGLNRLHQFDKVEIVRIAHPDHSYESLEEMVNHVENLVSKLELPYRILKLCGGDMSFTSALTYDFEVWSAAQKRWLEVSSVSNFESFQANRLKCRFKEKGEKQTRLAHTLNGSALALPRIVAALLENNQTESGIKIPKALIPYTGFDIIN